jgi:UDP-glucose 4-epimerase
MAKMVVVGGAGFIGSNLTEALLGEGHEVHVIDSLVGGKKEQVDEKATLHEVDMRDGEAIAPIIAGADTVFLLAALPRVQFSIEHPQETNEVNIGGIVNVLKAAVDGGVRRVVYSASSSAYGEQEIMPLVETMPAHPLSPYGLQKYVENCTAGCSARCMTSRQYRCAISMCTARTKTRRVPTRW